RPLRARSPTVGRVTPAGLLRNERDAAPARRATAAHHPPARAERSGRASHSRPRRLLGATLSGHSARAHAALSEARLAGGRPQGRAAEAEIPLIGGSSAERAA